MSGVTHPTSSSLFSSSSRFMGSPSQYISVSGATMQYGSGSVSTTLNSTLRMPPRTKKMSSCSEVQAFMVQHPILWCIPEHKHGSPASGSHLWSLSTSAEEVYAATDTLDTDL